MKKSTLAVAALLSTLSVATIVPAAYADATQTTDQSAPAATCCGAAMPKCCGAAAPKCCGAAAPKCCGAATPKCCGAAAPTTDSDS